MLTKGMAIQESENRSAIPRSIRHKRILDAAQEHPDASLDSIASEVSSATVDLVEQVLDEYGDPADEQSEPSPDEQERSQGSENTAPNPDDLSTKQVAVLRAISEQPDATQRELADILGVSGATVSRRANSITGFTWSDRQAFAFATLNDEKPTAANSAMEASYPEDDLALDRLSDRLTTIEQQVDSLQDRDDPLSAFEDAELMHKVVHACLSSDAITEEEELQILRILLR